MVDHLVNGACKHYSFEQLWCIRTCVSFDFVDFSNTSSVKYYLSLIFPFYKIFLIWCQGNIYNEWCECHPENLSRLYVCLATICCFLNDGYFARCEHHCFIKSLFYNTVTSFLKQDSILLKIKSKFLIL